MQASINPSAEGRIDRSNVRQGALVAGIALSIWAQLPGAWAACESMDAPPDAVGNVQYLADRGELLAWREWASAGTRCVQVDWPQARRLDASGVAQLDQRLAEADQLRRSLIAPALPRATVERTRRPGPAWMPPELVPSPRMPGPFPLCPRVPALAQMQPVEIPTALAASVLRVRPHRCEPGSRPLAGSGVLLSPLLGLTAAHVVMTPAGKVCSRYRVAPGGRRYNDPPAAPYGLSFVSRAALSGRGGWVDGAPSAPLPRAVDLDRRTRHDHAWLLLDEAAALPADVAWPRLRFGAPQVRAGEPVLSAGYPAQTPTAGAAPGAMVSLWGQTACAQPGEQARRYALWLSLGGSGGPIWSWSVDRPLHLLSLGARVEVLAGERYETLGPSVDLADYQRLLDLLADERTRRAAVPPKAAALRWAPTPAEPSNRSTNCAPGVQATSLIGFPGLSACRARCASRPRSCR